MDTSAFFDAYFNNAQVNSILIMTEKGKILQVNQAFTNNFGYSSEQIEGESLDILFTEQDRQLQKPEREIMQVLATGQAHDENYVVDQRGLALKCTGESLLVTAAGGERYIVKDIVNLQARKQLQLFLRDTEELLESIFDSSRDIAMMILDSSLKVSRANDAFLRVFELSGPPVSGSRLSDLDHPFWKNTQIRHDISQLLVTREPFKGRRMELRTRAAGLKIVRLDSKIVEPPFGSERKIFIIVEDLSEDEV